MSRTPLRADLVLTDRPDNDSAILSDLMRALEPIVRMRVAPALRQEHAEFAARLLVDEAELAVTNVLGLTTADDDGAEALRASLVNALRDGTGPDQADIEQHAAEVASIMVSAWLEFLDLALDRRSELTLGTNLLPAFGDADRMLFERLRDSLASTVIRPREAQDDIMTEFGNELLAGTSRRLVLPRGLEIERTRAGLLLRRARPHSASSISSATPAPPDSGTNR